MQEKMDDLLYLIQWEDRLMSVLKKDKIVKPKLKVYAEGQLITAKYGKQTYEAVICEIHPNLKYLQTQARLPPKYSYVEEQKKVQLSESSVPRQCSDPQTSPKQGLNSKPSSTFARINTPKQSTQNKAKSVDEDTQQRENHVNSIWAETMPSLPLSSVQLQATSLPTSPAASLSRGDKDNEDIYLSSSESEMSDSLLSHRSVVRECPSDSLLSPRSVVRNCRSCVSHQKKIEELQKEVSALKNQIAESGTMQDSGLPSGKPKAGIVSRKAALEFSMVEVYPQTDVWWYRSQRDAVLFNGKEQAEQTMSRTIDMFFSKEMQMGSSARGGGKYPPLNNTILDACLRFVQRKWNVLESTLIKVVNDKCSHQRRPKRTGQYDREKYLNLKRMKAEKKNKK